jgi:dTMP kinase
MTPHGKLIAIEGIDGSGKRTQVALLEKALTQKGHAVYSTGFPQYDSWFGKMVGQFLNGDFGALETVDPHFSALLYAGDRFEAKSRLEFALHEGKIVLADRYIASNLAHQTARVPEKNRPAFVNWIEHLEYSIYNLPRETLVLYLQVPPRQAQQLVARKSTRAYTNEKQDLQEASLRHLEDAAAMYDQLSRRPNWKTIPCYDEARATMRRQKQITTEILDAVLPFLSKSQAKAGR